MYLVLRAVDYEGLVDVWCDSLTQVKAEIKSHWGTSWDDFTVLKVEEDIDIYELMKEEE